MRKEMESIKAAARAGSVLSAAAPSVIGETFTCGARDAGDALTDRALMMRRDKTTREDASSPAPSSIEKVPSEKPDSLNFSSLFARSAVEVECRSFVRLGKRCSDDLAKCDRDAYAMDSENREYFEGLRARQE
jgi:hypothetical protein